MLRKLIRSDKINRSGGVEVLRDTEERCKTREMITDEVDKVKRKIRDSIFTKLFRDKSNLVELYKALNPKEDELSAEDVEIMTIESVMIDSIYNDLGFRVKGRDGKRERIILVEAQTEWDKNMPERMSVYAQRTRERYWCNSEQGFYQRNKMNTPMFEHYVIYTGSGRKNYKYMMLHDFRTPRHSMNLGIKVVTKVDNTICGQYIGFCKEYSKCLKKYKSDRRKALDETIKMCLQKGYLVRFLKNNLEEVRVIMGIFTTQEEAVERYGLRKIKEGIEQGKKEGMEQAIDAIEVFAKSKGFSIKEFVDICERSMKERPEFLDKLCEKDFRNRGSQEGYSLN